MPMWIMLDFMCPLCFNQWEDMVDKTEIVSTCTECGSGVTKEHSLMPSPAIAAFSLKDAAGRAETLKKRSSEHSQKELDREPEKFGGLGISMAKQKIQSGYGGKVRGLKKKTKVR